MTHEATVKERQRLARIEAENVGKISAIMKDYNMGVIPEVIDNMTTYEKLQEKLYTDNDMRKKLLNIFNNDAQTSDEFMTLFKNENKYTYDDFILVYNQLVSQFKGYLARPQAIYDVMEKLIKNVNKTGVATSGGSYDALREAQDILEEQFSQSMIGKKEGDDMYDKLDAMRELLSSDKTVGDVDGLMTTPEYQKAKNVLINSYLNITKIISGDDDNKLEALVEELKRIKLNVFKAMTTNQKNKYKEEVNLAYKEKKNSDTSILDEYIAKAKQDIENIGVEIRNMNAEIAGWKREIKDKQKENKAKGNKSGETSYVNTRENKILKNEANKKIKIDAVKELVIKIDDYKKQKKEL